MLLCLVVVLAYWPAGFLIPTFLAQASQAWREGFLSRRT